MTASTDLAITPDEAAQPKQARRKGPIPEYMPEQRSQAGRVAIGLFIGMPLLALVTAVPWPGAGDS